MTELSKGGFFERRFRLSERKTDVKTEFLAGLTTFMTMSYILAVNPNMLAQTGMDKGGVFTATVQTLRFTRRRHGSRGRMRNIRRRPHRRAPTLSRTNACCTLPCFIPSLRRKPVRRRDARSGGQTPGIPSARTHALEGSGVMREETGPKRPFPSSKMYLLGIFPD